VKEDAVGETTMTEFGRFKVHASLYTSENVALAKAFFQSQVGVEKAMNVKFQFPKGVAVYPSADDIPDNLPLSFAVAINTSIRGEFLTNGILKQIHLTLGIGTIVSGVCLRIKQIRKERNLIYMDTFGRGTWLLQTGTHPRPNAKACIKISSAPPTIGNLRRNGAVVGFDAKDGTNWILVHFL
jgi:hypothetical protein